MMCLVLFFLFKQKTAYEMRISDWSSDVCSSDLRDPAGQCTGCHTLTTQLTGQRFAADAVARPPWVSFPSWAQLLTLQDERFVYAQVAAHRTDWALRSGPGKIHPWMLPGYGNELTPSRPEISDADWRRLSDCLWGAGGAERSEEHTSELQSLMRISYAVFCLTKKK